MCDFFSAWCVKKYYFDRKKKQVIAELYIGKTDDKVRTVGLESINNVDQYPVKLSRTTVVLVLTLTNRCLKTS